LVFSFSSAATRRAFCALKFRAKTPSQFSRQILSALALTGDAIVVIKYFEFIIEIILLYIKSFDIFIENI